MRLLNDSIVGMQAPEILERSPATMASDVYSFGLVMWEVLVWQLPWTGEPMYTVSLSVSIWQMATVLLVLPRPHGWLCVQIPQLVINGGRPEIPSRPNLPGPDTASFASLDAYLALMR